MTELLTTSAVRDVASEPGGFSASDEVWRSSGLLVGRDGKVTLSGPAETLFHAWKRYLQRSLSPFYDTVYETPAFIDREVLDAALYAEHFPQHLIHGRARDGEADLCLTPAACFHVYPLLHPELDPLGSRRRSSLEPPPHFAEGFAALVSGPCARYEAGAWNPPFRLACFHMTELVVVGPREVVSARRRQVLSHVEHLFSELGLAGSMVTAHDAFFLGAGRGAYLMQQLKELKQEYQVVVDSTPVALASVNDHEDYFGRRFGLRNVDEPPLHSMCTAFGLERLTAIGLLEWGPSTRNWPEVLRA